MKALWLAVVLFSVSVSAMGNGKVLHDQSCMQCHAALMGGKANTIYQRSDKKVTSLARLEKQVSGCAVAADVNWTSKQHQQVVDYLATTFYGLK